MKYLHLCDGKCDGFCLSRDNLSNYNIIKVICNVHYLAFWISEKDKFVIVIIGV